MTDTARLRDLAVHAQGNPGDTADGYTFANVASPAVVVGLLDEIERLRALAVEACDVGESLSKVVTNEVGRPYQAERRHRLAAIRNDIKGEEK
jgi:hypothetical protein